jgi:predicted Fe-S protein YdhL (DUF1289 family)
MVEDAQPHCESPCTKVCVLGADGYCIGCLRDLAEIASWGSMSSGEQRRLLVVLQERRLRAQLLVPGSTEPAPPEVT